MLSDLVRLEDSIDSASIKGWDTGSIWHPVMKEILELFLKLWKTKCPNEEKAVVGYTAAITDKHGRKGIVAPDHVRLFSSGLEITELENKSLGLVISIS